MMMQRSYSGKMLKIAHFVTRGGVFRLLRAGFYFSDFIANAELKVGNRLVIGIGHAQIIQML